MDARSTRCDNAPLIGSDLEAAALANPASPTSGVYRGGGLARIIVLDARRVARVDLRLNERHQYLERTSNVCGFNVRFGWRATISAPDQFARFVQPPIESTLTRSADQNPCPFPFDPDPRIVWSTPTATHGIWATTSRRSAGTLFDVAQPGNGDGGHTYGTTPSSDPERAVLEYLKNPLTATGSSLLDLVFVVLRAPAGNLLLQVPLDVGFDEPLHGARVLARVGH